MSTTQSPTQPCSEGDHDDSVAPSPQLGGTCPDVAQDAPPPRNEDLIDIRHAPHPEVVVGDGIALGIREIQLPPRLFTFYDVQAVGVSNRFDIAPRMVIHDNACHLAHYCIMRELKFFPTQSS
jgi:hypothetical protein